MPPCHGFSSSGDREYLVYTALLGVQDELAAVDARVARAVYNATEAARRSISNYRATD